MLRALALLSLSLLLAACGAEDTAPPVAPADTARVVALPTSQLPEDAEGPLVIYTTREKSMVEPLVERFRASTGLDVTVLFGTDDGILTTLADEGDRSPADVLWSNSALVLGAAQQRNLLTVLPDSMRVLPGQYMPESGQWVPLSVRFRVLAYAAGRIPDDELPNSVLSLSDVAPLEGRLGWTPAHGSFQDFLTAIRLGGGDEAAGDWLDGMRASGAKTYPSDSLMLAALSAGEIDAALSDHGAVLRANVGGAALAFHTFVPGNPGNLGTVTGAGVLDTSSRQRAARRFVSYLLSTEAQAFMTETTKEIPVVAGTGDPSGFLTFEAASALAPRLSVERFHDIDGTLSMLQEREAL